MPRPAKRDESVMLQLAQNYSWAGPNDPVVFTVRHETHGEGKTGRETVAELTPCAVLVDKVNKSEAAARKREEMERLAVRIQAGEDMRQQRKAASDKASAVRRLFFPARLATGALRALSHSDPPLLIPRRHARAHAQCLTHAHTLSPSPLSLSLSCSRFSLFSLTLALARVLVRAQAAVKRGTDDRAGGGRRSQKATEAAEWAIRIRDAHTVGKWRMWKQWVTPTGTIFFSRERKRGRRPNKDGSPQRQDPSLRSQFDEGDADDGDLNEEAYHCQWEQPRGWGTAVPDGEEWEDEDPDHDGELEGGFRGAGNDGAADEGGAAGGRLALGGGGGGQLNMDHLAESLAANPAFLEMLGDKLDIPIAAAMRIRRKGRSDEERKGDRKMLRHRGLEPNVGSTYAAVAPSFEVSQEVVARFGGGQQWWKARVARVHRDGTCDLLCVCFALRRAQAAQRIAAPRDDATRRLPLPARAARGAPPMPRRLAHSPCTPATLGSPSAAPMQVHAAWDGRAPRESYVHPRAGRQGEAVRKARCGRGALCAPAQSCRRGRSRAFAERAEEPQAATHSDARAGRRSGRSAWRGAESEPHGWTRAPRQPEPRRRAARRR